MSGHLDLDVRFSRAGEDFQAVITRSPAGDGQCAVFARPLSDLELENFVLKVGRFRSRTRRIEAAPVAAAKLAGGRLFDAVFSGATGECLRRSWDRACQEEATLRIRLMLSGCAELSDLPWELLYDRSDDWFLALSGRTPVVRYVQLPDPPRPVPAVLPLRILVVRSEPTDYPALDLAGEWAQVAAALGELTGAGALAFTVLAEPTLGELRRALLRETFHVLHFMGHGGFDAGQGGVLMFTGPSGRGVQVTSGDLGVMLRDHTSLRLVVLNACEAGRTDPADPFAGVADTLVRRGIPAVIAMQFEVSDDAAVEFAPALYGALAAGLPVDTAVAEARKAMYTVSPLEWATPVLYLRADDARLFDMTQRTSPPVPASTAVVHADLGDRLLDTARYADAAAAYRAAIAADPRLARAHSGLGRALTGLEQHPEAKAADISTTTREPGEDTTAAERAVVLPAGLVRRRLRIAGIASVGIAALAVTLIWLAVPLHIVTPAPANPPLPKVSARILSAPGYKFHDPDAIAVDGNHIWVVNSFSNSVTELNASNGSRVQVLSASAYDFALPVAIAVDAAHIWVTNSGLFTASVTELSAGNGSFVQNLVGGKYAFDTLDGIADDNGTSIWVTNSGRPGAGSVTEIDASNGRWVSTPGYRASSAYAFNDPEGIAVDGADIWVANAGGNSVTELKASNGALVRTLSGRTYAFDNPSAIAVDGADVWVANARGNSVTELNASNGALVRTLSGRTYAFDNPSAIAVDGTHVWVTNTPDSQKGGSVTVLNTNNGSLARTLSGSSYHFDNPSAIAVDGTHIWVTNSAGDSVTELTVG